MTDRFSGRRRQSQAHPRRGSRLPSRAVLAATAIAALGIVAATATIGVFGGSTPESPTPATPIARRSPDPSRASAFMPPDPTGSAAAASPPAPPSASASPGGVAPNLYSATGRGMFSPSVAGFPARVYVPDEASGTVVVIDPRTFRILMRYKVGASPEHVTPDWDLQRLYVEAAFGNRLTVIDPTSGRVVGHHSMTGPYNLYFTLDGRMAIVVLDSSRPGVEYGGHKQVSFYDRKTWRLLKALDVPYAGADHLDFSADGRFLLLSTEYAGRLVRIDVETMAMTGVLNVGGNPIDVRLSPDGRVFYVANQRRNGVSIIDAVHLRELGFLRTGRGAHGLALSRDANWLYVSNRRAGSISVIDLASRRVIRTWRIGGSPDMIAVSPDGTQLWISNRFGGTVSVVNGQTGKMIREIRVGGRPHGLAYFPEPGRFSLGHNGIYR